MLLLTITATLNVAMWLWVVSTAVFCMLGVDAAEDQPQNSEFSPAQSLAPTSFNATVVQEELQKAEVRSKLLAAGA